jgi:hypothetical protein
MTDRSELRRWIDAQLEIVASGNAISDEAIDELVNIVSALMPEPERDPAADCKDIGEHDWQKRKHLKYRCRRCRLVHHGLLSEAPRP